MANNRCGMCASPSWRTMDSDERFGSNQESITPVGVQCMSRMYDYTLVFTFKMS